MTTPNNLCRDLDAIQRWMKAAIMHPVGIAEGIASAQARRHIDVGPDEGEKVVTRSQALSALARLGIYRYASYAEYLEQYPSRSYTLFHLGVNFPRFLAETRPDRERENSAPANWPDFL